MAQRRLEMQFVVLPEKHQGVPDWRRACIRDGQMSELDSELQQREGSMFKAADEREAVVVVVVYDCRQ